MPNSQWTKRILAEGLKDLMQTTYLSKLSIGDICAYCNISRNTFYYHFKDKYDLVSWIFSTETMAHMTNFSDYEHWADGLLSLCRYLQKNRKFYIHAMDSEGQNSFSSYLMSFYKNLMVHCVQQIDRDASLTEEETDFIARFYTHALVGVLLDWAKDGMKTDPASAVEHVRLLVNGELFQTMLNGKKA